MASVSSVCLTKVILQSGGNHHNQTNINKLEIALRGFLRSIQSLPARTAIPGLHILLRCLSVQATIEQHQVILIPSLAENSLVLNIIIRQIAIKSLTSSSWIIATQKLIWKYHLHLVLEAITTIESKDSWKKIVKKDVATLWKEEIENQAKSVKSHIP